jgi:hypothetical protein
VVASGLGGETAGGGWREGAGGGSCLTFLDGAFAAAEEE